jgi:hypothetical protein
MSKVEIYIVVEGQTEQTFVREILAPYMGQSGIYLHPSLIGKAGHKGGAIRFDRAKVDIINFLKQRSDTYVSTMFDYFRIHKEWPGLKDIREKGNKKFLTVEQKAKIVEDATMEEICNASSNYSLAERFIPYIQMHEFEALLFSDAEILAKKAGVDLPTIQAILNGYNNPEEINDDPAKAPSKQLEKLIYNYRKIALSTEISNAVGIRSIRAKCPHFSNWLTKLEMLRSKNHN